MDVAVFSTMRHDRSSLQAAAADHDTIRLHFLEPRLTPDTAQLAAGHDAVSVFVNDDLSAGVVRELADSGVRMAALRSAGYNHVDLAAAADVGMLVTHVPTYSPHSVAEHTLGLILTLNRHLHRAYNRVREGNFSLDGLMGFDMHGKTLGIIGTGRIGAAFAQLMSGFGMQMLGSDPYRNPAALEAGMRYVEVDELLAAADIITLFAPLNAATHHLINADAIARMRPGVMIINTSRGALIDTRAVIDGLKSGHIGALGLDVYEEEGALFYEDRSASIIADDVFTRLLTFPNVVITGHQAFFTAEAVRDIADATVRDLAAFAAGEPPIHPVPLPQQEPTGA